MALAAIGCGNPDAKPETVAEAPPSAPRTRVTDRPANLEGGVFIVEYHKIAKQEARWDRSVSAFGNDLERLYRLGFRPVSLSSYLRGEMDLAPGASPVVFTFDDSNVTQFRIRDDGSVNPDCAVGIWQTFAERHPDFPVRATFFALPPVPWAQKPQLAQKLEMLKEWGCELGSHTLSHGRLSGMSDGEVKQELSGAIEFVQGLGFECEALALPFGISPQNRALLEGFEFNGKFFSHKAALLVGAGPAPAPGSKSLDRFRLPRIQGIDGDFGITYWLDKVESGEFLPFVAP